MLLQRLDDGRAVALPDPRNAARPGSVTHQLDLLLGEQLLPLRTRTGPEDPHLLAVDASGQPVVVEVVGLLDEAAVLRALHHAGRAARMTTEDLAAAYRGGAEAFPAHFDAFRRTVPASSQLATSVRSGARLMIVCSDVDQRLGGVLEFLLQPGWQLEILRTRVEQDDSGARTVEVVPVERTAPPREIPPPRPTAVPDLPRRQPSADGGSPGRRHGGGDAGADPGPVHRTAPARASRPVVVPPAFAVVHGGRRDDEGPEAQTHAPPHEESPEEAHEATVPPVEAPPGPGTDPRVAELARRHGPTVLVWYRERRGQCHEALLHEDGSVELPDGTVVPDVDTAAALASGTVVDGLRVWRVGRTDGPSLAEVLGRL